MGVSFAFGLTVLTMAYAVGHVSGGHFNPAHSTGPALLEGGIALLQLWLFWLAPIVGGVTGAMLYNNAKAGKAATE